MSPRVRIKPIGNMGNQMLQYMCALNIQRLTHGTEIVGYNLAQWGLEAAVPDDFDKRALRVGSNLLDTHQIAKIINSKRAKDILLTGLGLRLTNFASQEFYKDIFVRPTTTGYDERYVVLNVRGAEILGAVHPDYHPMPFSFFDTVIESSNAQPVFLGQLGEDTYSQKLRERYPNAIFHPSRGALSDFQTLRASHQIALSVSTFSWLAGWLSAAEVIHYPLSGILNPQQRPDIDLTPTNDKRYNFYRFDIMKWSARPDQMESLWTKQLRHEKMPLKEVEAISDRAYRKIKLYRDWKKLKIDMRSKFISLRRKAP